MELTDEQLECVIGGMQYERFNRWRVDIVNEHLADGVTDGCVNNPLFDDRGKHRVGIQCDTNNSIEEKIKSIFKR
jgi:hypothetical protein